ncbi:MAG: hypothetical protein IK045_05635, partial [Bacteroidales bacterium]|nr:hypothetical protein [Bacteroidales bacterium]
MKKSFIYIILAACAIISCTKESASTGRMILSASMPEDQSKTCLGAPDGDGKVDVLWKAGDRISVNGILSEPVSSSD